MLRPYNLLITDNYSRITEMREPKKNLFFYHLLKWSIVSPMLHSYFRGQIYGAENVPQNGSLVIASNHASNFDPLLVANCVNRPVAFMAKEELFKVPVLKQAIELYGGYPVKRGSADRSAIKTALSCLNEGWAVGIFLQGTRTTDGQIDEPKLGAAMIAAKAKVPILPVSLWGTEKILQKGSSLPHLVPITVRIGQAIAPPNSSKRDELQAVTEKCAEAINSLHALGR